MNKQQIRKALNVPDDLRICQHIYNVMRDEYEQSVIVSIDHSDGYKSQVASQSSGIDIFYVEDEEFISKLSK